MNLRPPFPPREFIRIAGLLSGLAALLLLPAAPVAAHDFWIEPASFRPAVGSKVPLRLFVGMDFAGATTVYLPDTFERYVAVGPDGEKHIPGVLGDDPAGHFVVTRPGPYIVAYRSTHFTVTFDTLAEFEQYLEKEGLERIRTLHAFGPPRGQGDPRTLRAQRQGAGARGQTGGDGRPRARAAPRTHRRKNPYLSARVPVRLLYEGRPLEGALVVAFNKAEPLKKTQGTHRQGRPRTAGFHAPGHLARHLGAHVPGIGEIRRRLGIGVGLAHVRAAVAGQAWLVCHGWRRIRTMLNLQAREE